MTAGVPPALDLETKGLGNKKILETKRAGGTPAVRPYRHPRHSASPRPMIHSRSSAERKSSSSVTCVTVCR